jgi:hypothetical protein
VGELVLLHKLEHFHTGEPRQIEMAGEHAGEKLGRLLGETGASFGDGPTQSGGDLRWASVFGEGRDVSFHAVAKLLAGGFFPGQHHAGESFTRNVDMARDLAEAIDFGSGTKIEVVRGELFYGNGGVLTDGFPGIEEMVETEHEHIVGEFKNSRIREFKNAKRREAKEQRSEEVENEVRAFRPDYQAPGL